MRLAQSRMHGEFGSPAQTHPKWSGNYRTLAEFDGLGHPLELPDAQLDFIPLFVLYRQQELHQIGADGEILRVAGNDEAVEASHRFTPWLELLG